MVRSVCLILAGAVTGMAAVLVLPVLPQDEVAIPVPMSEPVEPAVAEREFADGTALPAPGAFAASLNALEAAAATADDGLESAIERLAAQPSSLQRDAELEALLAQLVRTDPQAAIRLAEQFELGAEPVARLYQIWASDDAEAALAALGGMNWPARRRVVALSMLDVFGSDAAGIDRVADAFGPIEGASFRIDAIGKLAETDLPGALAAAEQLDISQAVSVAQQRIATVIAGVNPRQGMEHAASIGAAILRRRYMDELLDSWAKLDPEAMLEFMETIDLSEMAVSVGSFRALATSSPEKLLALAEKFAPAQRNQAEIAALEVLASLDPTVAYNRVRSLPPSGNRNQLFSRVAAQYAGQDPEAALAWATSLEPRSPIALNAVLSIVATANPARAADAAIRQIVDPAASNRGEMPSLAALLAEAMQQQSPEIARVADMLAAHSDPRVRAQLSSLVVRWPQTDPRAAAEWAMRNPSSIDAVTAANFARLLASEDPALARQGLQQVPANSRAEWIEGAASGMAGNDLTGTLNWLDGFRGEPIYEPALTAALTTAAGSEPELVATQLAERPEALPRLAPLVARAWAESDPAAAERWVNGLEQGPARDRGLTGLLEGSAMRGEIDESLFDAFSTQAARADGVMSILFALGRTDPERARRLITTHISDPALRERAESQLEMAQDLPANASALLRNLSGGSGVVIMDSSGRILVQ